MNSSENEKYKIDVPGVEFFAKEVECRDACPVGTDAGAYVQAIGLGEFEKAYAIARGPNPFASICGWVCNAPCETACNKGNVDRPISIRALKRFVTEKYGVETVKDPAKTLKYSTAPGRPYGINTGEKVAIIGSGAGGLTAAHDLARLGYRVTIFESNNYLGGMFYLVPEYRLPRPLIRAEIDAIISMGMEVRLNTRVGKDITFEEIQQEYKAVVIAVGCWLPRPLQIEGHQLPGFMEGLTFLKRVYLEHEKIDLGEKVVIIGGGNVAMDCCRTAVRLGPKEVHVVCLENWEQMPADPMEIEDAVDEGIIFHPANGPKRAVGNNGKVTGLECIKVKSLFDDQRRFSPKFEENSEWILEADTIIASIGQASDVSFLPQGPGFKIGRGGTILVNPDMSTNVPGVFAVGDVVTGPRIFIEAIAGGQKAAMAAHSYLSGKKVEILKKGVSTLIGDGVRDHVMPDNWSKIPRENPALLVPSKRASNFELAELSYQEKTAVDQGIRCLKCHVNPIFNGDLCILCGGCVDICPEYALKMVPLTQMEQTQPIKKAIENFYEVSLDTEKTNSEVKLEKLGTAMIWDGNVCIRCGYCAKRCPTRAITMEHLEYTTEVTFHEH
ncbi:MAG: FAD-dependent oxidoreductase [Nitrospirae bacterium]|nr:FAD-dependent oxidoreductase [Nitrospirota bacterium]MBI3594586.1 FAD-dependent oxidoreductase [Nitrospirota bacterium]